MAGLSPCPPAAPRPVRSAQIGPHPRLEETVRRHLQHRWRRPIAEHTRTAWAEISAVLAEDDRPLVLDSGCGTGESTHRIAARHPEAWVLGVDKSAHRLGGSALRRNGRVLLARAELADLWRCLDRAVAAHYLLYPNPWPKAAQLSRRWAGHPVLPWLLGLGGRLEVRSNWPVYLEEFAAAIALVTGAVASVKPIETGPPLSPFERKYRTAGHPLAAVTVHLPDRSAWPPAPGP